MKLKIRCEFCSEIYQVEGSPLKRINDLIIDRAVCNHCKKPRPSYAVAKFFDIHLVYCQDCGMPAGRRKRGKVQKKYCNACYMNRYRERIRNLHNKTI